MLGQCLFQLVQTMYLTLAREIAGMLLGIYYAELQLSEVQGELFNTQWIVKNSSSFSPRSRKLWLFSSSSSMAIMEQLIGPV